MSSSQEKRHSLREIFKWSSNSESAHSTQSLQIASPKPVSFRKSLRNLIGGSSRSTEDSLPNRAKTPQPPESHQEEKIVRPASAPGLSNRDNSTRNPWEIAYELAQKKLEPEKIPPPATRADGLTEYHTVLQCAQDAKSTRNANKIKYTNSAGEQVAVRDKFDRIVKGLDTYAKIIDVAINHSPEITALVWAGTRLILQVYLNHEQNLEGIEQGLETILTAMATCEFYESVYRQSLNVELRSQDTSQALKTRLWSVLPEFYCAVLVFSVKAKSYLEPKSLVEKAGKPFQPFSTVLKPYIDDIKDRELAVKELATMASMQELRSQSSDLKRIGTLLEDMKLQFSETSNAIKDLREHFSQISDEKVLTWLQAKNPEVLYRKNQDQLLEGTCEWITEDPTYQAWIGGKGTRNMWIVGIPGAGKSVLSASIVDRLKPRGPQDVKLLYFFFRHGDRLTMSPLEMVISLISQILSFANGAEYQSMMHILRLAVHQGAPFSDRGRTFPNVCIIFAEMLKEFRHPVVILLDALDECSEPVQVVEYCLGPSLEETNARCFITGRPVVDKLFDLRPNVSRIRMNTYEDILKFIETEVAKNKHLMKHKDLIIETVSTNADGMFRYAALVLDELNRPSRKKLADRIKTLPKEVAGMYELILRRLGARGTQEDIDLFDSPPNPNRNYDEELELRHTILMWIAMAYRPMSVAEMQYALAAPNEIDVLSQEFDPDGVVLCSKDDILGLCDSLVEVFDEDKLRFTHLTVKEFLLQSSPQEICKDLALVEPYLINPVKAHMSMAIKCVSQLFILQPNTSAGALGYAILYWGEHGKAGFCPPEPDTVQIPDAATLAELFWTEAGRFLWGKKSKFENWSSFIHATRSDLKPETLEDFDREQDLIPETLIAACGFKPLFDYALRESIPLNFEHSSALQFAICAAHFDMFKFIFDAGVDPNYAPSTWIPPIGLIIWLLTGDNRNYSKPEVEHFKKCFFLLLGHPKIELDNRSRRHGSVLEIIEKWEKKKSKDQTPTAASEFVKEVAELLRGREKDK